MSALKNVQDRVVAARAEARKEAKSSFPFVWSRGTHFGTVDRRGDQCSPFPAAEALGWDGTLTDLRNAVAKAIADPEAVRLYIEGGFDGGERMSDRTDCNYEPWASSWSVDIWSREEGLLFSTF